jgi:YidC/Oxa1 family membrane protein insertase
MISVFATNPLQPLINVFEAVLVFFHGLGLGWGLSIVALTVCVRICLLPLTLKQFKSMQSMALHRDDIQALQAKYKGDRDRLNQEMMKFYKENQINPLASCLPLVAQIPVFISLFYMLRHDLLDDICGSKAIITSGSSNACPDTSATQFLFINNITEKATGGVLVALIVLYVGSQLVSTVMSTVNTDNTQKYIMWALPFVFVAFVINFPAGLLVYWITTNLWTIFQQLIVKRRLGPMSPPRDPSKPKPPGLFEQLRSAREPAPATAGGSKGTATRAQPKGRTTAAPPAPPRKKKKRSGRRR